MIHLDEKLLKRVSTYTGSGVVLGSAIGALVIGQIYGWRAVSMIHSPDTVSKYNKILGVRIQDVCPERTELSRRMFGIRLADKFGAFWKIARGSEPLKGVLGYRVRARAEERAK